MENKQTGTSRKVAQFHTIAPVDNRTLDDQEDIHRSGTQFHDDLPKIETSRANLMPLASQGEDSVLIRGSCVEGLDQIASPQNSTSIRQNDKRMGRNFMGPCDSNSGAPSEILQHTQRSGGIPTLPPINSKQPQKMNTNILIKRALQSKNKPKKTKNQQIAVKDISQNTHNSHPNTRQYDSFLRQSSNNKALASDAIRAQIVLQMKSKIQESYNAQMYRKRRNTHFSDDDSNISEDNIQNEELQNQRKRMAGIVGVMAQGKAQNMKPNPRFKNYTSVFQNLLRSTNVQTKYPIVICKISHDSSKVITLSKSDEHEFFIQMFDVVTAKQIFLERVGGDPNQYIKIDDISEFEAGDRYAVSYFDLGKFNLRTFRVDPRSQDAQNRQEFLINDVIGIDDKTMVIDDFDNPFITSKFIDSDTIFVNLFHNKTLTHYHFLYDVPSNHLRGQYYYHTIEECSTENFPIQSFYCPKSQQVYSFYRQGQCFTIDARDPSKFELEWVPVKNIGNIYLYSNQVLITRSSSQILLMKRGRNEQGLKAWMVYHTLSLNTYSNFKVSNKQIQVTTEQKIFFYTFQDKTMIPILEDVVDNYMQCSTIMFGGKENYCITFKQNQKSFDIYRQKYIHSFKQPVYHHDFNKSLGLELKSLNSFVVTRGHEILMFNSDNFQPIYEFSVPYWSDDDTEQIISLQKSQNELYIAVIVGEILIRNEQRPLKLFVYTIEAMSNDSSTQINLTNTLSLQDLEGFNQISMNFYFKNTPIDKRDSLIFARIDQIFELNFDTGKMSSIYVFKQQLNRQPQFFKMNIDQNIMITASPEDGIYTNLVQNYEVDIDEQYKIGAMKQIIFDNDDNSFYILANSLEDKLGIYLLKIGQNDPCKTEFLIKWKNKLNVNDVNVFINRNAKHQFKELIVTFKSIYINIYSVIVLDISRIRTMNMLYRHESFQLWEEKIMSIMLFNNMDLITVNKQGISVLAMGADLDKRAIKNNHGQDIVIHAMDSFGYLKLDKQNSLLFDCSEDDRCYVKVQQEYIVGTQGQSENVFEDIYNVCLKQISLRKLLLFQSLYLCKPIGKLINLVRDQPRPLVFFQSFLELDGTNMVSILSFDSRSMKYLLSDQFKEYFSSKFPLFYKNKIQKGYVVSYEEQNSKKIINHYFYRSALGMALQNNQVAALSLMIKYIVNYQNNFASSFMFLTTLPQILQKGIELRELLDSEVFNMEFEFDDWPSIHNDDSREIRGYNGSIFNIRNKYRTLFPEDRFDTIMDEEYLLGNTSRISWNKLAGKSNRNFQSACDVQRIFKIKYKLNLLPQIGVHAIETDDGQVIFVNDHISPMRLSSECGELDIFLSEALQEMITFKWTSYALRHHFIGCIFHLFYMTSLALYTYIVYDQNIYSSKDTLSSLALTSQIMIAMGTVYPALYDWIQMYRVGIKTYLSELWNYIDMTYILASVAQVILHTYLDPFSLPCKLTMTIVIFLGMGKTFFFLRIFENLSPIVTMLSNVVVDLGPFMLFFFTLIVMFSMQLGIIGLANIVRDGKFKDEFGNSQDELGHPGSEYYVIGSFLGNMMYVFRAAMGDFSVLQGSIYLSDYENWVFWIMFFLILTFTNIIFLNFVIAEAGNSYSLVSLKLEQYILREKANLIDESETMIPKFLKDRFPQWYPKYLVIRQVDQ